MLGLFFPFVVDQMPKGQFCQCFDNFVNALTILSKLAVLLCSFCNNAMKQENYLNKSVATVTSTVATTVAIALAAIEAMALVQGVRMYSFEIFVNFAHGFLSIFVYFDKKYHSHPLPLPISTTTVYATCSASLMFTVMPTLFLLCKIIYPLQDGHDELLNDFAKHAFNNSIKVTWPLRFL